MESGVNWIDTAVYELGHSEEVVAAALAGFPEADRPYVFPKGVWSGTRPTGKQADEGVSHGPFGLIEGGR